MSMFDKCDVKMNGNTPVTIVKGSINNNGNNNNNGNGIQSMNGLTSETSYASVVATAATQATQATQATGAATIAVNASAPESKASEEGKDDRKEERKDDAIGNVNLNSNNQLSNALSGTHALGSVGQCSNRFTPYQVPNAPRYQRHRRASTGSIGDDADFKAISSIAASDTMGGIVSLERAAGLHYGPARGSNTYTMTRDEIITRVEMGLLDPKFLRFFDKNQK